MAPRRPHVASNSHSKIILYQSRPPNASKSSQEAPRSLPESPRKAPRDPPDGLRDMDKWSPKVSGNKWSTNYLLFIYPGPAECAKRLNKQTYSQIGSSYSDLDGRSWASELNYRCVFCVQFVSEIENTEFLRIAQ